MPDLEKLQHVVIGGTNGTTDSHPADSITTNSDESNPAENLADNHKNDEQKETTKQKPANGEIFETLENSLDFHGKIILGAVDSLDESTLSDGDSLNPNTPIIANDETNDSDSHSSAKR